MLYYFIKITQFNIETSHTLRNRVALSRFEILVKGATSVLLGIKGLRNRVSLYLCVEGVAEDVREPLGVVLGLAGFGGVENGGLYALRQRLAEELARELHGPTKQIDYLLVGRRYNWEEMY